VVQSTDLAALRKKLGVSQKDMAQLIDSTQQTVSKMEKGEIELTEKAEKLILRYTPPKKALKNSLILKPLRNGELKTNELECTNFEHLLNLKKDETSRDWERWWWHRKHPLCLQCTQKCKQSKRVTIIMCPQCEKR